MRIMENNYAEKYVNKHHCTVEEAMEANVVKEYYAEHSGKDKTEKETNVSSQLSVLRAGC